MPADSIAVNQLFIRIREKVRKLSSGERAAVVRAEANGDEELADAVISLFDEPRDSTFISEGKEQAIPEQLGDCTILERLGTGGMAEVYRAYDNVLKREVAVKVQRISSRRNPNLRERFRRERELQAKIDHPNVAKAYQGGAENDILFLVMELVIGENLQHLVELKGPLPPFAALALIRQAGLALQCLEAHKIIHRDIKPANLIIDRNGVLKVVDLGLARSDVNDGLTQYGHSFGTPHYMAPEQRENPAAVDHRADIYSVGGTFYFLLTGAVPVSEETARDRDLTDREQLMSVRPAGLSDAIWGVVRIMMAQRPEDRFANATALIAALDACVAPNAPAPQPNSAPPPIEVVPEAKESAKPGVPIYGVIALLLLVALGGEVMYLAQITKGIDVMQWLTELEQLVRVLPIVTIAILTIGGFVTTLVKQFGIRWVFACFIAVILVIGVWYSLHYINRRSNSGTLDRLEITRAVIRKSMADAGPNARHFRIFTMMPLLAQPDRYAHTDIEDCQNALRAIIKSLTPEDRQASLIPLDSEKSIWMLDLRLLSQSEAWLEMVAGDPYLLTLDGMRELPGLEVSLVRADAFIVRVCTDAKVRDALGIAARAGIQNDPAVQRVLAKYQAPLNGNAIAAELYMTKKDLQKKAESLPPDLREKIRPLVYEEGVMPRHDWTATRHGCSLFQRLAEALNVGVPEIVRIHAE